MDEVKLRLSLLSNRWARKTGAENMKATITPSRNQIPQIQQNITTRCGKETMKNLGGEFENKGVYPSAQHQLLIYCVAEHLENV